MSAPENHTEHHSVLAEVVRDAVAEGIRQATSDPQLWADALSAMRRQAASSTGNLVLDALMGLGKRIVWIGIFCAGLYAVGGWGAIGAAVKAFGSTAK